MTRNPKQEWNEKRGKGKGGKTPKMKETEVKKNRKEKQERKDAQKCVSIFGLIQQNLFEFIIIFGEVFLFFYFYF